MNLKRLYLVYDSDYDPESSIVLITFDDNEAVTAAEHNMERIAVYDLKLKCFVKVDLIAQYVRTGETT